MIKSMTGFAGREDEIASFGKISVELRSTNHKFLEAVLHLPEGFLSLEDKIKKEIEGKIKRGRVLCVINIMGGLASSVFINKKLLKNYIGALKDIKGRFRIQGQMSMDNLIHLPGVLSLVENRKPLARIWPALKILVNQTLEDLAKTRQKEGRALYVPLRALAESLKRTLDSVKARFKKVIKDKLVQIKIEEERVAFLKDTDITEEIERLVFHIRNFTQKISKVGPVGKELDFIAQEMQREANTIGAKSCDAAISAKVVQIKSQIEKIREQVQNIE
jgi:uncharacterized protein (TIGR00255 family)